MSEIFENATASIIMGIEDFKSGSEIRMLSAARNYYAGLLLLAKECLIRSSPDADPMEVIGARFKPMPDQDGGVKHVVEGYATIDLHQLKKRFKDFELQWPDANIDRLQQYRNDLEHFHLKQPTAVLSEAIASSFPMVIDFFSTLKESPQSHLKEAWTIILEERETFERVRKQCLDSLEPLEWPADVKDLDLMSCPSCHSSLIGQSDAENNDPESLEGLCFQCGGEIEHETMIELVVAASFEEEAHELASSGMLPPIATCPECLLESYVTSSDFVGCFSCGEKVSGECARCGNDFDIHEYNPDYPGFCGYCSHMAEKVMRE